MVGISIRVPMCSRPRPTRRGRAHATGESRARLDREFRDVVFEDVVFVCGCLLTVNS